MSCIKTAEEPIPRECRSGNAAEIRRAKCRARIAEIGVVECVKTFGAIL